MSQTNLEELLLQWENQRQAGKTVSVDELCRTCPHLKKDLLARIQALERMNQVLNVASVSVMSEKTFRQRTRYDELRPNWEPIPGYRLEKKLGKGGFGEVWKAIGPGGFSVVLKFVSMSGNLGASELRSLEVIKTLRHPNLLATFGSWQAHGFLVIAMELADRTLLDRLQEAVGKGLTGIPRDELIGYMQEAAKGIDYLNQPSHRLGDSTKAAIQHRDINPQNILLMGGGIKIGDFGILRILKTTVTEENGSLTLSYAPPEIILGHAARSSDQYSLAVTYCHLRGGRLPFVGHPGQVMDGHLKNPPDLSMIPEDERGPVARALNKDAKQRWSTCGEFVIALTKDCDSSESTSSSSADQSSTNPRSHATSRQDKKQKKQDPFPAPAHEPSLWIKLARFGGTVLAMLRLILREIKETAVATCRTTGQLITKTKRKDSGKAVSWVRPLFGYATIACIIALIAFLFVPGPPGTSAGGDGGAPTLPKHIEVDLGGGITMTLLRIEPGKFVMGSPKSENERRDNEGPQHEVEITKPFYMGVYPVTQEQWQAVMGNNPSYFKGVQQLRLQ